MLQIWNVFVPAVEQIEAVARQTEVDGFDGLALTDSQNLSPDIYIALALAAKATLKLGLATGVTNPVTRHPAVTASAISTIQLISGGRAVLGIGRGDSALFNIGREPVPLKELDSAIAMLQRYLSGSTTDINGWPSKLRWIEGSDRPKVPIDVAATGPKVIGIGARHAERVSFAVGANPERLAWAVRQVREQLSTDRVMPSLGAYLHVAVDDDIERGANMLRSAVGTFAHFSGMKGSRPESVTEADREVFRELDERYDRQHHGRPDSAHAQLLPMDFICRFGVVGSADACSRRLCEILDAGIERLIVIGPNTRQRERQMALDARARFAETVMPRLRDHCA